MFDKGPWDAQWNIKKRLGEGGQGFTFLVESQTNAKFQAVLKTLRWKDNKQARARMVREVTNLESLSSEGVKVPKVIESNIGKYKEDEIPLYFIMDYIQGVTLSTELKDRTSLSLEKAHGFVIDIAKTISDAHKKGVLHRDIKPDNIMVRDYDNNDLVIVDYGISFNRFAEDSDITEKSEPFRNHFLSLPETNTPGGDRRDYRSDIRAYSLTANN